MDVREVCRLCPFGVDKAKLVSVFDERLSARSRNYIKKAILVATGIEIGDYSCNGKSRKNGLEISRKCKWQLVCPELSRPADTILMDIEEYFEEQPGIHISTCRDAYIPTRLFS
ncbi:unnamed protein product [Ceutorhynchus assimilis]|uniref:Uncharacterized protein n=1 Tax=Ceutorhynchus assimilis TaxID=467358 RepID=A0A9N9MDW0_9CUCU|nr:unnamed protein product [Ceutorhynchus assimilis]